MLPSKRHHYSLVQVDYDTQAGFPIFLGACEDLFTIS